MMPAKGIDLEAVLKYGYRTWCELPNRVTARAQRMSRLLTSKPVVKWLATRVKQPPERGTNIIVMVQSKLLIAPITSHLWLSGFFAPETGH